MSEIEKGLRAIHRALVEQGKILGQIRDLLVETSFEEPTIENTAPTDHKAIPAIRTFDPDVAPLDKAQ